MDAGTGTPLWRDRVAWALAALAAVVYGSALTWGLPSGLSEEQINGWDVDGIVGLAPLAEFHNLLIEAKPDWFVAYPLFHYVLLGACSAPYLAWLFLTGGMSSPGAGYPYGLADPATSIAGLALIGRSLTMVMAVGIVLASYRAAHVAWDRRAAILTALIVLGSGPMVYRARTGNLDVPFLFWTALGVVVLAAVSVRGLSIRRAALLGACAALATASKDQAYGGWVAVVGLLMILQWRGLLPDAESGRDAWWKPPGAMIVSGLVVYSLAGGILFWPHRYIAHMEFILTYEEARFAFEEVDLKRPFTAGGLLALAGDVVRTVAFAMGPFFLLAAAAGGFVRRGPRTFLWLVGAMLAGYLVLIIVPIAHIQYRYALLPAFLLAFPAGRVLAAWLEGSAARRRVATLFCALGFGWLAAHAAIMTWQMWFDARRDAGDWLAEHVPSGARVSYFGDDGQLPAVPAQADLHRLEGGAESLRQIDAAGPDFILVIPDYTSPPGLERSLFLAADAERALEEQTIPYALAARFETRAPLGLRYPFVNPPVRIYARSGAPGDGP